MSTLPDGGQRSSEISSEGTVPDIQHLKYWMYLDVTDVSLNILEVIRQHPSRIPLWKAFLEDALQDAARNEQDLREERRWQQPMWHFVRIVKAAFDGQDVQSEDVFDAIVNTVDIDWSECFFVHSEEDARMEFDHCWEKIRFAHGQGRYDKAFRKAQDIQVRSERAKLRPDHYGVYDIFLSIAYHMQKDEGDNFILLPERRLSEMLGVSIPTISRYRHLAQKDGYLIVTKKHTRKMATEFRFDTSKVDEVA